jgi:hypothetical protein
MNGLRGARLVRGDLVAGELATFETDIRWWLVVQRLRLGIVAQFGLAPDSGLVPSREGDDLEVGSTFGWGSRWSLAAFGAYALQPVDHVQVWFGARAGGSFLAIPLYSSGRHYADLRRDSWSAGPELGLRFYAGCAGVMFWGFADLVQLGVFQAGVSFSFEFPVVSGTAF